MRVRDEKPHTAFEREFYFNITTAQQSHTIYKKTGQKSSQMPCKPLLLLPVLFNTNHFGLCFLRVIET